MAQLLCGFRSADELLDPDAAEIVVGESEELHRGLEIFVDWRIGSH